MKIIPKHNVHLEEAMGAHGDNPLLYWFAHGLHVNLEQKELVDFDVGSTGVSRKNDNEFNVVVTGSSKSTDEYAIIVLDAFSSIDEIKEKYPQLFKLDGDAGYIQVE